MEILGVRWFRVRFELGKRLRSTSTTQKSLVSKIMLWGYAIHVSQTSTILPSHTKTTTTSQLRYLFQTGKQDKVVSERKVDWFRVGLEARWAKRSYQIRMLLFRHVWFPLFSQKGLSIQNNVCWRCRGIRGRRLWFGVGCWSVGRNIDEGTNVRRNKKVPRGNAAKPRRRKKRGPGRNSSLPTKLRRWQQNTFLHH